MKIHDSLSGLLLVLLAGSIYWVTGGFPVLAGDPVGPALFPRLIAAGLALCGLAMFVTGLVKNRTEPWVEVPEWLHKPRQLAGFVAVVGGLIAYHLVVDRLGFLICAPLLLGVLLRILNVSWRVTVPVAIGVSLLIHTIFYKGLGVPLPWGLLQPWSW